MNHKKELDRFDFPVLERVHTNDMRFYKVPGRDILMPSATTVLAATKKLSPELQAWIKRKGEKEATWIKEDAAKRGDHMHNYLESALLGTPYNSFSPAAAQGKKMADKIVKDVLSNHIDTLYGSESRVWYYDDVKKIGFAGTTDLFVNFENKDRIYDFKQANREKTEEMVHDYFLQVSGYARAINFMHGTSIEDALIIVCGTDLQLQLFDVNSILMSKSWNEFEIRLQQFYTMYDIGSSTTAE